MASGLSIPEQLQDDSSFIATVEWSLRPGDSRVVAYYITTSSSKYWFLIECTVDDCDPCNENYLGTRTTVMIEKGPLEIKEAALLLIKCAWPYEKENGEMESFFIVSDDGLLDVETVEEIANLVWQEEIIDEQKKTGSQRKTEPIIVYGSGYIINGETLELKDDVSMAEFAEAFPFFKTAGWGLLCVNIDRYFDGSGHSFITNKIKARIGKYLKTWDAFDFITYMRDEPLFPGWLDAEYDPESKCYHLYGLRTPSKGSPP